MKLLAPKYIGIIVSIFLTAPIFVFAQGDTSATGNSPSDAEIQQMADGGPKESDIEKFKNQFGAPPSAFEDIQIAHPDGEVIQAPAISDEMRKYVSDKDLVSVYCAMMRWKSGNFFLAMDALKTNLLPAIAYVKSNAGIQMTEIPDIGVIQAEGTKRINAICAATTALSAQTLIDDFILWSRGDTVKAFDALKTSLQTQMKKKGDELKIKIEQDIQPIISEEKAGAEAELKAEASSLVESKISSLKNSSGPVNPESIKAEIMDAVKARVEMKRAQIESRIKSKIDSIIKPQTEVFEKIGQQFNGMDDKIQGYIKENSGKYESFKNDAFTIRKQIALKVIDASVAEGLKQLGSFKKDLLDAKTNNADIKTYDEVVADIALDRKKLEGEIDVALQNGDDSAFEKALKDFQLRWEAYRSNAEKAGLKSMVGACQSAIGQFNGADKMMSPGIEKIKALQTQCGGNTTDECLKINEFGPRFETILSKFDDLTAGMKMARSMCSAPDKADQSVLIALLKKIQNDAEETKIFGLALEAEKNKSIADSAVSLCKQVLPQLNAVTTELRNDDLIVLKASLKKCSGVTSEQCKIVNSFKTDFESLVKSVALFQSESADMGSVCSNPVSEEKFLSLSERMYGLKTLGDSLKNQANTLRIQQQSKGTQQILCKSVAPRLEDAKAETAKGLQTIRDLESSCTGNQCVVLKANVGSFRAVENKADEIMKAIAFIDPMCKNAGTNVPSEILIGKLNALEILRTDMGLLVNAMKKIETEARVGTGIAIEAEQESSSYILPIASRPAVNTKEINPSWRPAYYGTGDWYLAAGGEWLSYTFTAPIKGVYSVWVRDYTDNFQAKGIRRIVMLFNGYKYGTFAENASVDSGKKGIFAWHKVGSGITLQAGSNTMKVMKESTTRGAAVLDAFYLTTTEEIPLEK
jgi:DNA-binding FrmR family transcriptional regulator